MNLRTPGPIPVPDDILESMSWQMINHRGPEYKDLLYRVTDGVKRVFGTRNDLYILTSSGTGAMEAAIVNTLSPGDKVINVCVGVFGQRFGEIAEVFGAEVVSLDFPFGSAADPDKVRETLLANPDAKAVLVTHNETSTGVTNDLQAIARVIREESDALVLVDGISSVCSIPINTDAWGCDVVVTASQKGWMLPPGLAFISFGERAWQAHAAAKMPRYYFDMAMYKRYYEIGQPPYTPAISVMFALDVALERIMSEGIGGIYERHATIGKSTREGVKALGLTLFPDESVASDTVTAVNVPDGIDGGKLVATLRDEHDVVLTGGQGPLGGKIFRIGHLGYTTKWEIREVMVALFDSLLKMGRHIELLRPDLPELPPRLDTFGGLTEAVLRSNGRTNEEQSRATSMESASPAGRSR